MRPCLFPVGESDFVQMRQNGAYYVDKTLCLQNLNGGASFLVIGTAALWKDCDDADVGIFF